MPNDFDVRALANEFFADSITREEWLEMGHYKGWIIEGNCEWHDNNSSEALDGEQ